MTTTTVSVRFTSLPDERTLASIVTALEGHGFSVEVVHDLDAARQAVLARIPHGSLVMTTNSVTLQETDNADAVDDGGQPDYALGSVHAVTHDGTLPIASASGS